MYKITLKRYSWFLRCIAFLGLFSPFYSFAQLTTSNSLTPTQLVQTMLLGGGLTATNITFNGDPSAIGSFGGTSNIGFGSGIIMASGDIANAIGPNDSPSKTTSFGNSYSDPQLSSIANGGSLYDAAILEFDFIPHSDTIKFRYVFGSDEYMEFVNSDFNDAFGFFISGPNPAGGSYVSKNIAIIPGTSTPVAINNLNLNNYGPYYFDNGNGDGDGTAPDGTSVQYDGFTKPLMAVAPVVCGQQYHIKLAITDVADAQYDSGVFLEAGSFVGSGGSTVTSVANNFGSVSTSDDTTIYEGCGFVSIIVHRQNTSQSQTYPVTIAGTASNGADYNISGTSVSFGVGQDTASIIINSLPDGITESTETVLLTIIATSPCGGSDTLKKNVYIVDTPPMTLSLDNDTSMICPPQNMFITAQANGGAAAGGYTYQWQNFPGSTQDTLHIHPFVTTSYIVTVSDKCGHSVIDTFTINLDSYTPMHITISDDTAVCLGYSAFIQAHVTDGIPGYTYSWSPNVTTYDSVTVIPDVTTNYIITATDACGIKIKDTSMVTVYPISANFSPTYVSNQSVRFNNISVGGVHFYWDFGDGTTEQNEVSPEHTFAVVDSTDMYSFYTVTLVAVNPLGCSDTTRNTIKVVPDFTFFCPNTFTPNGDIHNEIYTGAGSGIKSYKMMIFNRWGEKLYETADIRKGWDGTYKGILSEQGVYNCVFELSDYNNKKYKRYTDVNLLSIDIGSR